MPAFAVLDWQMDVGKRGRSRDVHEAMCGEGRSKLAIAHGSTSGQHLWRRSEHYRPLCICSPVQHHELVIGSGTMEDMLWGGLLSD